MDNILDSWCGACGRKGRPRARWLAAEVVGRRATPRNKNRKYKCDDPLVAGLTEKWEVLTSELVAARSPELL